MTNGGAAVLLMDNAAAQPTLDIFRGVDPGVVREGQVQVEVFNGAGVPNQAHDVGQALTAVGFDVVHVDNFQLGDDSDIQYAPGSEAAADLLARFSQLTAKQELIQAKVQTKKIPAEVDYSDHRNSVGAPPTQYLWNRVARASVR